MWLFYLERRAVKIAIALSTFSPNTQAKSSEVNTNFTNIKTATQNASYRAFTWMIKGSLIVADEQGMKYIAPQAVTASKLWYKTTSGTCTLRIQKDGTNMKASQAVTSTTGSTTSFDNSSIAVGDIISLDLTAASSGVDLIVTLETMVTDNT